ncbi:MAG: phosphatidylinositol mannoside acyltransferase [Propionibacteriaceae bacterium]
MINLKSILTESAMRAAWRIGPHLSNKAILQISEVGARLAVTCGVDQADHWEQNVAIITGKTPSRADRVAAVASYLRYWLEMVSLPGWDQNRLEKHVRIDLLTQVAAEVAGGGCVVALPHMGNWDLVGAYACRHGLKVSTIAEELPQKTFSKFLRYRESLGFTVRGHRATGLTDALISDAQNHQLVCLVADRDLKRRGVPVLWTTEHGSVPITMPAGPAIIARRSGATLRGVVTHYEDDQLIVEISDPIDVGKEGDPLDEPVQQLANFFANQVCAHSNDWHLFQPFFGALS